MLQQQCVFEQSDQIECWATQYFPRRHFWLRLFLTAPVPRVNEPQISIFSPPRDYFSLARSTPGDMTPNKNLYQNIRLYVTFISVCGDWLEIYFKGKEKLLVNDFIKVIGYIFGSNRSSRCHNLTMCVCHKVVISTQSSSFLLRYSRGL